jgi:hypothetical protein
LLRNGADLGGCEEVRQQGGHLIGEDGIDAVDVLLVPALGRVGAGTAN